MEIHVEVNNEVFYCLIRRDDEDDRRRRDEEETNVPSHRPTCSHFQLATEQEQQIRDALNLQTLQQVGFLWRKIQWIAFL